ncbi:MAG: FHA domain-containing protein [Bdellovibrionales bacterium]|nr:FHA domain-containing protein [Ramlibacter sp.]
MSGEPSLEALLMPPGIPDSRMLGVLQAHDRTGALVARAPVMQWPVTIGRALDADLVLDDAHVAPEHLRVDRAADGAVTVQMLDTVNGVVQHRRTWRRGEQFAWAPGEELLLGRLKLSLRLVGEPLAAELPLSHFPWRTTGWTVALAAAVLLMLGGMAWLANTESRALAQRLPGLLAASAASLAAWAGLWAMATRIFTGKLWFWRHVRIACATVLGSQALQSVLHLLAFMFSLESLARFDLLINVLAVAAGIFVHLTVIAPHHRRGFAALVAGVALVGAALLLGTSWLQTGRLSNQLYMATVFPPGWRVAPAVPLPQFLDEAQSIRKRLEKRLKDKDTEGDAPAADAEDEE